MKHFGKYYRGELHSPAKIGRHFRRVGITCGGLHSVGRRSKTFAEYFVMYARMTHRKCRLHYSLYRERKDADDTFHLTGVRV